MVNFFYGINCQPGTRVSYLSREIFSYLQPSNVIIGKISLGVGDIILRNTFEKNSKMRLKHQENALACILNVRGETLLPARKIGKNTFFGMWGGSAVSARVCIVRANQSS